MDGRPEYPGLLPPSPGSGLLSSAFSEAARRSLPPPPPPPHSHFPPRFLPPSMALHGSRSSYLMGGYLPPPAPGTSGHPPPGAADPYKSPLLSPSLTQYWSTTATTSADSGLGRYMPGLTAAHGSVYSPYLPLLGAAGEAAGLSLYGQPTPHQPYHRIYDLHKEMLFSHQSAQSSTTDVYHGHSLMPHRTSAFEALLASGMMPSSSSSSSSSESHRGSASSSATASAAAGSNSCSGVRGKQEHGERSGRRRSSSESSSRKLSSTEAKSSFTIKSENESGSKLSHRDHNGHSHEGHPTGESKGKYTESISGESGSSKKSKRTDYGSRESGGHRNETSSSTTSRRTISPCEKVKTENPVEQCTQKKTDSNSMLERLSSPTSRTSHKSHSTGHSCLHPEKPKIETSELPAMDIGSDHEHYKKSQDGALCLSVKPKTESYSPTSSRKGDVGDGDIKGSNVSTATVTTITTSSSTVTSMRTTPSPERGLYSMYPSSKPLVSAYLQGAGMALSAENRSGKPGFGTDYAFPHYQPGIAFPQLHGSHSQEGRKVHATTFTPEVGTLPSATLTTSSVSASSSKSHSSRHSETRTKHEADRAPRGSGDHSRNSVDYSSSHILTERDIKSPPHGHSSRHVTDMDTKPNMETLPGLPRTSSGGHMRLNQGYSSEDQHEREAGHRDHSGQAINLSVRMDHKHRSGSLPHTWTSVQAESDMVEDQARSHVPVGYIPFNVPIRDIIHDPHYPDTQAGPGQSLLESHRAKEHKVSETVTKLDLSRTSPSDPPQSRIVYEWEGHPYSQLGHRHIGPIPAPRSYLLPYDPMIHLQGMQTEEERRRLVDAGLLPRHLVMCNPLPASTTTPGYSGNHPASSLVSPPTTSNKQSPQEPPVTTPDQPICSPPIGVTMETKMIHKVEGMQPQVGQVYTVNAPVIAAGGQMIKVDMTGNGPSMSSSSDIKPLILPGAPLQVMSQGKYPPQYVVAAPFGVATPQPCTQILEKEAQSKVEEASTTSGVNIPVGIAVARQRHEKTTTKKESDGDDEEDVESSHVVEEAWSKQAEHKEERTDFHRDQKSLIRGKHTSSSSSSSSASSSSLTAVVTTGTRDARPELGSNLVVTGGDRSSAAPRWQDGERHSSSASQPPPVPPPPSLGVPWVPGGPHSHPLGPGLWLGPSFPLAPGNVANPGGAVDSSHLPMPPPPSGGVKLAQDPLTGQLFLIPEWPTYPAGNPHLPPSHQLQLMAQYSQLQQQEHLMQQSQQTIQPLQHLQQQQQQQQPKPELTATVAPQPQTSKQKDSESNREKSVSKVENRETHVHPGRPSPPRHMVAPTAITPRSLSPQHHVPSPIQSQSIHSPTPNDSHSPHTGTSQQLTESRQSHQQDDHVTNLDQPGTSGISKTELDSSAVPQAGTAPPSSPVNQHHPFIPGVPLPSGQHYPLPYPSHLPYIYDPNLMQLHPIGPDVTRVEGSMRSQGTSPITVTLASTASTSTATVSTATTGTVTDRMEVQFLRSISVTSVQTNTSPDAEMLRASVREQSIQTNGDCDNQGKIMCPSIKAEKPCVILECGAQTDMPTLEKKEPHSEKDMDLLCKDSDSRKSVSPLPPTLLPEGDPIPCIISDNIPDIDHFKKEDDSDNAERNDTIRDIPSCLSPSPAQLDTKLPSEDLDGADGLELLSILAERAEKQAVPEFPVVPTPPAAPPPRRVTLLDLQLPDLELEFKDLKSDPDSENSPLRCTDSPDINRNYNAPKMSLGGSSSPSDKKDNPLSSLRHASQKKESALGQFASSVFKIPTSVDNMDAMELEMRMRLAELQRRYKEKQRELARLQPKRDKDDDRLQIKRGPGRPRKRKFSKSSKHDRSPSKTMKLEFGSHPSRDLGGIFKKSSSTSCPSSSSSSQMKTPKKLNTSAFQSHKPMQPYKTPSKDLLKKSPLQTKPSSSKKKPSSITSGERSPLPSGSSVSSGSSNSKTKVKVKPQLKPPSVKSEESPQPPKITPSKKVTPSKPPKVKTKPKKVEPSPAPPVLPPAPSQPPPSLREYDFPDDDEDDILNMDSSDESDLDDINWFEEVQRKKQRHLEDLWATSSSSSNSSRDSFDSYCEPSTMSVLAKYSSSEMDYLPTSVAAATSAALKSKKRKKRPDDTGMDEFDEVPVKKRKPGRPKKCDSEDSGVTETIVAKKPKKITLIGMLPLETKESSTKEVKKPTPVKPKPAPKEEPKPAGPPVFLEEEWGRRRSERIFLNDPNLSINNDDVLFKAPASQKTSHSSNMSQKNVSTSSSASTSSSTTGNSSTNKSSKPAAASVSSPILPSTTKSGFGSPAAGASTTKAKVNKEKAKPKTTTVQDLSQKVKKKYAKSTVVKPAPSTKSAELPPSPPPKCNEPVTPLPEEEKEQPKLSELALDSDSSSDGDNVPLSTFVERCITPEPRSCVIDKSELRDGVRVLLFMEGLFFEGQVKAIQPPDVYGVVIDGERGSRPHILSLEEILKDAVIDVQPQSPRYLTEGTRICAYWSQQFSCLYPGTVAKGSPNPSVDRHLICVEFDDGDSGRIPLEHIRMLPQDFPVVNTEPNPIMFLGKRRRRTASEELMADTKERKPSLSDTLGSYILSDDSRQRKRGPGRPPKKKGSEDEAPSGSKTGMPTIDETLQSLLSIKHDDEEPEYDVQSLEKLPTITSTSTETKGLVQESATPVLTPITSSASIAQPVNSSRAPSPAPPATAPPTPAPTTTKKKHKHKDKDKVKKEKKNSGQSGDQEHSKHKHHHHKKHKDKDRHREKNKEKKHKKHSSSSSSSVADSASSPRSMPSMPVLSSNSVSTNTEPAREGIYVSLSADLARSPQTSSVGTNTSANVTSAATTVTAIVTKPPTPKRSDLTMRIRTNSGEFNRADFTTALRDDTTEESADSLSLHSTTDDKPNNTLSDQELGNSEDENVTSNRETADSGGASGGQKSTKPILQKQTSSGGAKKKKDRQPSVENRSKIAAFLPARQLWRWSGKSTKRPGMKGRAKKEFYKAITRGKETIRVGDCAVFLSTGRPNLPYVGRIESLWEAWGGNMVVKVKWFYHPEETKGGKRLQEVKGALYQSPHVDENDVQTISHKCELFPYHEYKVFREQEAREGREYDQDVYYLAGTYDPTIGMITFEKNVKLMER